MSSQSTSIADLPRTNNSQNDEDPQESMMVNSILQDIENDEDLNDVNEDSLNYTVDTSQIPPKIGPTLPSRETIQETTETLFNDNFNPPAELLEPNKNDIDDFLNSKLENENKEEAVVPVEDPKEETILEKLEKRAPYFIIVIVSFFLLSLPALNKFIVSKIPKLTSDGRISHGAIFIKSLIAGLIYLVSTFLI